jgi:hypothetical protein
MDAVPNFQIQGAVDLTLGAAMAHKSWIRGALGLALLTVTAAATPASAQPLGVFRWQQQPFCNVLNLVVTATPSGFRMEGTDDQCGGVPASAIGMAYPKPDSTIGVGLTLVFASAVALHVDGTINPGAGFSGSWSDSAGRAGALILTPGAGTSGPLRPVVAPVDAVTYGATVTQPLGGGDRGLSVAVTTDAGAGGDAAAVFGQFGGGTGFTAPGSAGVRGDSAEVVGVMGTTNSGWGVVGAAGANGIGVQGSAEGPNSIGVHALHDGGGTALDIDNGAIKVSGSVRAAFKVTLPIGSSCLVLDHPLLNNDPTAMVFISPASFHPQSGVYYDTPSNKWGLCVYRSELDPPLNVSVLVIKQ